MAQDTQNEDSKAEKGKAAAKKRGAPRKAKAGTASAKKTGKKTGRSKSVASGRKTPARKKTAAAGGLQSRDFAKAMETTMERAAKIYPFPNRLNPNMENVMKQGKVNTEKLWQDAGTFGRDQFEAMVKSSTILAKGCEDIVRTSMGLAQTMLEKQTVLAKEAMTSKSLNEWAETQNKIAQANFDDFMSCATKLSEMSIKVLNESTEPLNRQMTRGMKKASESMAA